MRWVMPVLMTVAFIAPCSAAGLSAPEIEARLTSDAATCPPEGTRLTIVRVDVVGAREHNQVRKSMGAKADGREGQRYATIVVRHDKQTAPVASIGPIGSTVTARDLQPLRGATYCDHDQS